MHNIYSLFDAFSPLAAESPASALEPSTLSRSPREMLSFTGEGRSDLEFSTATSTLSSSGEAGFVVTASDFRTVPSEARARRVPGASMDGRSGDLPDSQKIADGNDEYHNHNKMQASARFNPPTSKLSLLHQKSLSVTNY